MKHLPQSLSSITLLTELNKSYELSNALVNEKALKNLRIFIDKRIYIKVIKFNVSLNGAKKIHLIFIVFYKDILKYYLIESKSYNNINIDEVVMRVKEKLMPSKI